MGVLEKGPCPCCNENYFRDPADMLTRVCFVCRNDFGCGTAEEVQDLLEFLQHVKPEDRAQFMSTKSKGRSHVTTHSHMAMRPTADPLKVAAGIRALSTYEHTTPLPAEGLLMPTNYVWAANGAFEVRHNDIADIVLPLSPPGTTILGLTEKLTAGVRPNLPKIPFDMLAQTVAFFRGVVKRFSNGEAIVRIWWNVAEKAFEIRVPEGGQRVSGASVHHDDNFDLSGERQENGDLKYLHVMDIHSHNSMSGFWSGVDDNDEKKAPEGRMFGVLGKVTDTIPDWKWRMRSRDGFIELKVTDIFEVAKMPLTFEASAELADVLVTPVVTMTVKCTYDPFTDATCPEAWYATVNQGRVVHSQSMVPQQRGFFGFVGRGGPQERKIDTVPSYIFIEATPGTLAEYEVLNDKVTPTGKRFTVTAGAIHDEKK